MKVEFYLSIGYVGAYHKELVEFDDEASEEEIEAELQSWIWEKISCGWKEV